jgi:phosphoglycerate-specific signal transduction histidine kinase
MRLTKKDLIGIISTLSREREGLFDETQTLKEDIKELEKELEEKIDFEDSLDAAKDLMELIKASRWKLSLGVESEREELEKLTEKLEETLS